MNDTAPGPSLVDVRDAWDVAPTLGVRAEDFGALAYDGPTRRLLVIRSAALAATLSALADQASVAAAMTQAGVAAANQPAILAGLNALAGRGLLQPRSPADGPVSAPAHPSTNGLSAPPAQSAPRPAALPPTTFQPAHGQADPKPAPGEVTIADECERGTRAPICITWELTYACNLACTHCLSSSGRRDERELTTQQAEAFIDELQRMNVFYANIGGGEPTLRADFWHLIDYATQHSVGIKFSTNGHRLTPARARELAQQPSVDVQVSLDGATAQVNDAIRGAGSFATATRALGHLADAGFPNPKLSVVMTRQNISQLDAFAALADRFGATLRLTRLRPSGRAVRRWDDLRPSRDQLRSLHEWLLQHGQNVLTGDSFFHLSAFGERLPGMNVCGAGRVVCLIDPVGDVYACPFALDEAFRAGNICWDGGFERVWTDATLFHTLRTPSVSSGCAHCPALDACRGGCVAAKFFTGLPLDGPDPECVAGRADGAMGRERLLPIVAIDHSRRSDQRSVPPRRGTPVTKPCSTDPLQPDGWR